VTSRSRRILAGSGQLSGKRSRGYIGGSNEFLPIH
jgi:hypothetical protein